MDNREAMFGFGEYEHIVDKSWENMERGSARYFRKEFGLEGVR